MPKKFIRLVASLQIGLVFLTGCHPTQPFYLGERSDLAHYIDTATQIEYPDLKIASLPEATETHVPYSVDNHEHEFLDLTLEECIAYALVNTKIVRAVPGSNQQSGDIAATILASPSTQLTSTYEPAITASTSNPQAHVIDQNGNRILARGAARANQVGGVEDALSEFDAQFSAFAGYSTTDRPRNVGPGNDFNPQFFRADDATTQAALSKRYATGGVATMRSQTIYSLNNIPSPGVGRRSPSDYTQIIEAQVQHPLMRGRGTLVNRIPVVLARINEDISIGQYEERIRNLVRDVEITYWDLYCSYWNVETSKLARESAADVWRAANAKFEAGQGSIYSRSQAAATYHNADAVLKAALQGANLPGSDPGVYGRERRLRHLMGWAPTDGRLIRPSDKPTEALLEFDWWAIQGETLTRNIDLRQQKWAIKQRELELISAKNQILPELNATALYRWVGVGDSWASRNGAPSRFPTGSQSSIDSLVGGDFQEGSVRLELTPGTIGQRRQQAGISSARFLLAKETETLREKEVSVMILLSDEISLLKSHHQQLEIKMNEVAETDIEIQAYNDKIRLGEGSQDAILAELLRAQQRRAAAQRDYYRAICEYNKNIVRIHALKGSLLEYNNICMQEGPWPEKAYWDANEHARRRDAARYLDYGASRPSVISQGPYQQHLGSANEPNMQRSSVGKLSDGEPTPAVEGTSNQKSNSNNGDSASESKAAPESLPRNMTPPKKLPLEDIPAIPVPEATPAKDTLPPVKANVMISKPPVASANQSSTRSQPRIVKPAPPQIHSATWESVPTRVQSSSTLHRSAKQPANSIR